MTVIPAVCVEIGADEQEAVRRVLESRNLAQGTEVAAFETEFSVLAGGGLESVAVNSGTSALHLLMVAMGLGPGDEVIVPSFTFAATANCVAFTGASPVFVDIDADSYTLNPDAVEAAVSPRTQGVVPVHLYGQPANMSSLVKIAERHGLWMIEDAAQAHLARWRGGLVSTWGSAGAFSFYPTKNMTSGEGGMIVTGDPEIARQTRLLRNQGQERRYKNEIVGLNNRMTEIHAAIGRVQLSKLEAKTVARRQNARFFDDSLRGVVTPFVPDGSHHVYHQYTIRVPGHDRDGFAEEMRRRGIETGIYYPFPCHRLPPYQGSPVQDLTCTEDAAREVISLPVYPSLTQDERERIVEAVNEVAAAGS